VESGLKRHLDGARFFNATVAGQYSPADVAACFDTVSICFSKGLGCPMGSILVGSRDEIMLARRARKMFGGALRQAGIVAAAAIYALENHVDRLQQDHDNAQLFAQLINNIDGVTVAVDSIESNLVFFEVAAELGTAVQLSKALRDQGVAIGPMGGQRLRAATHLDVTEQDIRDAAQIVAASVQSGFQDQPLMGAGPYSK
jgi:threonine aldolase